jgi:hypothetical protein
MAALTSSPPYSGDLRRAEEVQAATNPAVGEQSWEMTLE